jgi:hypothetical protein
MAVLKALITIDTEVYPLWRDWRTDNLRRDIERDIYGETSAGSYGLTYQLRMLEEARLKAVFFVEGLFSSAVGLAPLRRITDAILERGHEVQLHLHPEWLEWIPDPPVEAFGRGLIREFSVDEQTRLVEAARRNLELAGAPPVVAFRAGDFAANADTLEALRRNGIRFDSSSNPAYAGSLQDVPSLEAATQATALSGVCEIPIAYWNTSLGRRPAQLTACGWGELRAALNYAVKQDWRTFVIVSHSFELLKKRRRLVQAPQPDVPVVRRFNALCSFLRDERDTVSTVGFSDLSGCASSVGKPPMQASLHNVAWRLLEQAYRRFV